MWGIGWPQPGAWDIPGDEVLPRLQYQPTSRPGSGGAGEGPGWADNCRGDVVLGKVGEPGGYTRPMRL